LGSKASLPKTVGSGIESKGVVRDGNKDSSAAERLESPAFASLKLARGRGFLSESSKDGSVGLEGMACGRIQAGFCKREEEGNKGVVGGRVEEGKQGDETTKGR